MAFQSKNSRIGRQAAQAIADAAANEAHNFGCLRKYNFSTGAGWKSKKTATIGGVKASKSFEIRRKVRGRSY